MTINQNKIEAENEKVNDVDANNSLGKLTLEEEKLLKESDATIRKVLEYEKRRYKRKGYGLIVAVILSLSYFFYMPKVIHYFLPKENEIKNPGLFYAFVSFFVHEVVYLLANSYYIIIYFINLPFFERYKVSSEPWPWQQDKEEFRKLVIRTIKQVSFNHLVVVPLVLLPNIIFNDCPYRLNDEIPSIFEIIAQIIFCMICEDFAFYWSHRTLHTDYFYGKIHKLHHEYKETICISSEYAHPIEYLLGNILPTNLGGLILGQRMHIITSILVSMMVSHEAIDGHSGYEFSWSPHRLLPMSIGAEFHIFHHLKFKGNYASLFTFWDRVGNTINKAYMKYYFLKEKTMKID